jgi:hypothetical protein
MATIGSTPSDREPHLGLVSALPGSPYDGQTVIFQTTAMAAEGIAWQLRYRSGSALTYKWEFIGGGDWYAEAGTVSDTTGSTTYAIPVNQNGPAIVVPLPGYYIVEIKCSGFCSVAGATMHMSYEIGATAASDNNAAFASVAVANTDRHHMSSTREILVPNGNTQLLAKYRTTSGTFTIDKFRTMKVRPVALAAL